MTRSFQAPIPGCETQTQPADLTERAQRLTTARGRLARLIDLDERELIDLKVEMEARDRGVH